MALFMDESIQIKILRPKIYCYEKYRLGVAQGRNLKILRSPVMGRHKSNHFLSKRLLRLLQLGVDLIVAKKSHYSFMPGFYWKVAIKKSNVSIAPVLKCVYDPG